MNAGAKSNVYVSDRLKNPEEALATSKENFTWAGILAIISTLFFIVLVILLLMERNVIQTA